MVYLIKLLFAGREYFGDISKYLLKTTNKFVECFVSVNFICV